jgi:hypothetical protein
LRGGRIGLEITARDNAPAEMRKCVSAMGTAVTPTSAPKIRDNARLNGRMGLDVDIGRWYSLQGSLPLMDHTSFGLLTFIVYA